MTEQKELKTIEQIVDAASAKDTETIHQIVARAKGKNLVGNSPVSLEMDLHCANDEFNLRLDELLEADDFNFSHDIVGIQNNLDREQCKMTNLFVPRYANH